MTNNDSVSTTEILSKFESIDDLILLKIFTYLPIRKLINLSLVCKRWHSLIKEEISKRNFTQTFLINEQFNLINKRKFVNSSHIFKELSNLMIEPCFTLCFLTNTFDGEKVVHNLDDETGFVSSTSTKRRKLTRSNSSQNKTYRLLEYLYKLLPNNSDLLLVFSYGTIGTSLSRQSTVETEFKLHNQTGICGLSLPFNKNYRFSIRSANNEFEQNAKFQNLNELNEFFGVKQDETLKYILILINTQFTGELDNFFDSINLINERNVESENVIMSGGYVTKNENVNDSRGNLLTFVCLIVKNSEDENVFKCAQVTCCAKGKTFFNENNYESSLFKKAFPLVPLVGFYAYGEVGHDYLPVSKTYNNPKNKNPNANIDNRVQSLQFKSIFTIISLKP